jgi:hypothetical protein
MVSLMIFLYNLIKVNYFVLSYVLMGFNCIFYAPEELDLPKFTGRNTDDSFDTRL